MLNNIVDNQIKILFVTIFSITVFLTSCSNIVQDNQTQTQNQNQTQILIEYALYDFPLPEDAEIQMDSTVILGSGDLWAGQIILLSKSSPVELIKYFTESAKSSGWNLASSTISEKVLLVFNKNERIATIEISKYKRSLFSAAFSKQIGAPKTKVKLAINHPNSVKNVPESIAVE